MGDAHGWYDMGLWPARSNLHVRHPRLAGTPPACDTFFAGDPVVSRVSRFTTGYKLKSLRLKDK
jgi:hypothetical protein